MGKIKYSRYNDDIISALCKVDKYHEKAQPIFSTILTKMDELETVSSAKASKFKQYSQSLFWIAQRPIFDPNEMVDGLSNVEFPR